MKQETLLSRYKRKNTDNKRKNNYAAISLMSDI